jgi:TRAP-type C4-dicarboxylate transport system substrate-binding protein
MLPRPNDWFLALLLALCAAVARPLPAAELKFATLAPEGSVWLRELRAAGAEVARRTEGRVTLKWYPAGVQGTDARVLRKLRIGQLHGGTFTMSGLAAVHPDAGIYGLPLLFRSEAEVAHVRAPVDDRVRAALAGEGIALLGIAGGGFALFMGLEPVAALADLRGRKIWLPEGDEASARALAAPGLSPTVLPVADVLTGLQTGLLDVVAAPAPAALIMQWHTRVKYVTDLPLAYSVTYLAADQRAVTALAPADRGVLVAVLGEACDRFDARSAAEAEAARKALVAAGIRLVTPAVGERPGWESAVRGAYPDMVRDGVVSPALLAEVEGLLGSYRRAPAATAAR